MHLSITPDQADAAATAIQYFLQHQTLSPDTRSTFIDAMATILDALDDEAERQHLDRCYPEGGY